jgi:hypothetical protein
MEKLKRNFTRTYRFENQINHHGFEDMMDEIERLSSQAKIKVVKYKVEIPKEPNTYPVMIATYLFRYKKKAWKKLKKERKPIPQV